MFGQNMKPVLFFAALVSARGSQVMCKNDADYDAGASVKLSGFDVPCSMINSNSYLPSIQGGADATKCMQVFKAMGMGPETHAGHILGMSAKVCCKSGPHVCADYVTNVCVDPTQFTYDGTSTWPQGGCQAAAGPIDKTLLNSDGAYTADCTKAWLKGATDGDVAADFFQAQKGCCGDKGVHCGDVVVAKTKPDCDPKCLTTAGSLEIMLSQAHLGLLTADVTTAKSIVKSALAATAVVHPVAVTISSMMAEGTKIARRLSMTVDMTSDSQPNIDSEDDTMTEAMARRLITDKSDKNLTVGWEIKHTSAIAPAVLTETKLKQNIESEATKAGLSITVNSAKGSVLSSSSSKDDAAASGAAMSTLAKGLVLLISLASSRMIWLA